MQITVKSIKVLKKGTGDYGDWKLVKVTTEDTEYTTFADGAETLIPASIINITDMDKDSQGRESFKKYEVIEQASTPESTDMTKDDWSEKQKIERESIEAQTAVKSVIELAVAIFNAPEGSPFGDTEGAKPTKDGSLNFLKILDKALAWCEAKIDANMESQSSEPKERIAKEEIFDEPPSKVDPDWLKETLDTIHWKEVTAKSWIQHQLKVPAEGTLTEVLDSLDEQGLNVFVEHISAMRVATGP